MEILALIITTIIAIAAIIIPIKRSNKKERLSLEEDRNHLILIFRATKALSIDLQVKLERLIKEEKYKEETEIFPGITFKQYIFELESSREMNLSDQLFEMIKTEEMTNATIKSMTQSLEDQSKGLRKLIAEAEIKLR